VIGVMVSSRLTVHPPSHPTRHGRRGGGGRRAVFTSSVVHCDLITMGTGFPGPYEEYDELWYKAEFTTGIRPDL